MEVLIHADDMAATEAVTESMLACWESGVLDGFSVLANGDGVGRLREGLRGEARRDARIGVHLNLSEGPSSAPSSEVSRLVDREGKLSRFFPDLLLERVRRGRKAFGELLSQVETEWRAQMVAVQEAVAPRRVTVVDGHNHVHMVPGLFGVAARLAVELGIPEIRVTAEPFFLASGPLEIVRPAFWSGLARHSLLKLLSRPARAVAARRGLRTPGCVIGLLYSERMTADIARAGIARARRRGFSEVEVFFHVGRATEAERARWDHVPRFVPFYLGEERDAERREAARLRALLSAGD